MAEDETCTAHDSLVGWVLALIDTGYGKSYEWHTPSGSTFTLYQNPLDGKAVILLVYPSGEWVAFYPLCGFWGEEFHPAAVCIGGGKVAMIHLDNEEKST